MHKFANFAEAEKALEKFLPSRLTRSAYTTEFIVRFLDQAGNPQNKQPAIHIAGTSGKTSTAYYAAALLLAAGKRVGLLTSPHLEQINERVQIDMQPLDEQTFCSDLATFLHLVDQSGITLSRSELLYAFAFWEFARHNVDYIVIEVGLGGLRDATNVMARPDKICAITDIGLDHTNVLGGTLTEIAMHKAGIIGERNTVCCHRQSAEIMRVIERASKEKHAELHVIEKAAPASDLSFLPKFQQRNFALALAAATGALGKQPTPAAIQQATHTHIPGRMEVLRQGGKTIMLDGAHNPQKLGMLRQSLPPTVQGQSIAVLVAFTNSSGRDLAPMLSELAPIASHLIITAFPKDSPHTGRPPHEIAAACDQAGIIAHTTAPDPYKALQALLARPEPVLLVTGSLYLLGYIRSRLRTTKRTQKL